MSEANNNPATNCQQKGRAVAVDMGTTNQPSVGAAQWAGLGGSALWAGLGGSALCYTHQTLLLMTIGAGLLSAGGLCSEQRSLRQLCHKHLVCHHQSPVDLGYTSYFMFEPIPLTVSFMQTIH